MTKNVGAHTTLNSQLWLISQQPLFVDNRESTVCLCLLL